MEVSIVVYAILAALLLVVVGVYGLRRLRAARKREMAGGRPESLPGAAAAVPTPGAELDRGLSKTRGVLWGGLSKFLGRPNQPSLADEEWNQLEEALLAGDVGVATTQRLLGRVKDRLKISGGIGLRDLIEEESLSLFSGLPHGALSMTGNAKPLVVSVVGVNGVGKTTTIGKLARSLSQQGRTVLLGAGDTFRAAAISQLRIWAERTGSQFVTGREGADPGAVAFDALTAGKARGVDVVLLDTAGRLHTKSNLMEELKKVHRVMKKVIPEAPHETWLVVDGTLGQNSIQQAREFQKTLDLTGIVITKLDGTAKGGAVLAIASELRLPIRYIGVGESADDLIAFEPKPFVQAILGGPAR